MAWAWRGNHKYYYRCVREGRKVTKQYVGPGPFAEVCAQIDAEQQAERKVKREAWRPGAGRDGCHRRAAW